MVLHWWLKQANNMGVEATQLTSTLWLASDAVFVLLMRPEITGYFALLAAGIEVYLIPFERGRYEELLEFPGR